MTTSDLVAAVYLKATGKRSTLTSSDEKWLKILAIANDKVDEWQNTPNVDWSSLYNPSLSFSGTITATDTFAIPSTVRKISDTRGDFVRIYWTDGTTYTNFEVVPADRLKDYTTITDDITSTSSSAANVCAQVGTNLVFARTFATTDSEYGGTIKAPVYLYADTLVSATPGAGETTTVPVDIPRWLVYACAGEYVRNDITKQNQYPNLVQEANELLQRMIDDNDAQINEVYIGWSPLGREW